MRNASAYIQKARNEEDRAWPRGDPAFYKKADADCRADALMPQLVAERHIYESYEILEVRCESGVEGCGDVMAVRISTDQSCGGVTSVYEVMAGYVWRDGAWQLEDVENTRSKFECVGASID